MPGVCYVRRSDATGELITENPSGAGYAHGDGDGWGPRLPPHERNVMLIDEPALSRLVRWMQTRLDQPILCTYGTAGEMSEPRCEALITRRTSRAAGHPGYCSHAHAALAQDDQIL